MKKQPQVWKESHCWWRYSTYRFFKTALVSLLQTIMV